MYLSLRITFKSLLLHGLSKLYERGEDSRTLGGKKSKMGKLDSGYPREGMLVGSDYSHRVDIYGPAPRQSELG
jgi:hypothetical protein